MEAPHTEKKLESISLDEREELAGRYAHEGITAALDKIDRTYGRQAEPHNRLAYHNRDHTEGVLNYVHLISEAIRKAYRKAGVHVEEREFRNAELQAGFHDSEQVFRSIWEKGTLVRTRVNNEGEKASTNGAVKFMRDVNTKEGKEVFEERDIEDARIGIPGTIPIFVNGSVSPTLFESSREPKPLSAVILALADLAVIGMGTPDAVLKNQYEIFFEMNPEIADAALHGINKVRRKQLSSEEIEESRGRRKELLTKKYTRISQELGVKNPLSGQILESEMSLLDTWRNLTPEELKQEQERVAGLRQAYRAAAIEWMEGQVQLLKGRKSMVVREVEFLPELARGPVLKLYKNINQTEHIVRKNLKLCRTMSFENLMKHMRPGLSVFE